ncbi:MAG: tetratricopeptide repeat protein [Candidatus Thorarchaeota archaeon]
MTENIFFPEIRHYLDFMTKEEREFFSTEALQHQDKTLTIQLEVILKIIEKVRSPSDILIFVLGKILFNLAYYDKLEIELEKYNKSDYLLYWFGYSLFRKGDFKTSEAIFEGLTKHRDPLLLLEAKIGLVRILEREGDTKKTQDFFKDFYNEIKNALGSNRKNIFFDTYLRGVYVDLWIHRTVENVTQSIKRCTKALQRATIYGDRIHIANLFMMSGILEKYLGQWDSAKEKFNESKFIFEKLGDKRGEIIVLSNLADVERIEGELDLAESRLLSVVSLYEKWEDRRSLATIHSTLGEIYSQKKEFKRATKEFLEAREILTEISARDEHIEYALAELYLEQKNWEEFNTIMGEIVQNKTNEEINENPHILYFYGKKESQNLNLSKAKRFLSQALLAAGKKRMDYLGAKILIDSLQIMMYNFVSKTEEDSLDESWNLIEDLKIFIYETKQDERFKNLIDRIEDRHKKITEISNESLRRGLVIEIQESIKELANLVRYTTLIGREREITFPNQLIVLHRSGIPIKRYVKTEKIFDDLLLFGGMVRAAKDIITEVFTGEIGKVMKIDYGQEIKILAEFGEKETGIVMITKKDTFHQRRALHESVTELNKTEIPQQFYGDISAEVEQNIDEIIHKWFGEGYIGEK